MAFHVNCLLAHNSYEISRLISLKTVKVKSRSAANFAWHFMVNNTVTTLIYSVPRIPHSTFETTQLTIRLLYYRSASRVANSIESDPC